MSFSENHAGSLLSDAPLLNAQYQVLELLGEGGMGRVFRAVHRLTGQQVAIKALRQELSSDDVFRNRFLIEAQALSRLDHPSITHLYNFIEEQDGRLFLVMQYVAGRTLEGLIQQIGPLPPAVAMTLIHHILEAFDYAHAQRVVHRDIKPANIVLPPSGGVKVMDFGIARIDSDIRLTTTGASLGSPAYMSPEQITGQPIDHRCDIYSLGVLLFEMMTGDIPYPGDNGYIVMKAHVELPIPDPREIVSMPDKIAETIMWAMAKRPEDRPGTAAELSRALPTAEELGGSEEASWVFVLDDHRSAIELNDRQSLPTGFRMSRAQRPARPGRPITPYGPGTTEVAQTMLAESAMGRPASSLPQSLPHPPVQMPRSSPVPALLAIGAAVLLIAIGMGRWMGGGPAKGIRAAIPAGAAPPALVVKGAEMVFIPAGDEVAPFYLDRVEVTWRQFSAYLEACPLGSECGPKSAIPGLAAPEQTRFQRIDHPVSQVTHRDAEAYCQWAGKRLPTSAEWTRAGRGEDGRKFPWGGSVAGSKAWVAIPVTTVRTRPGQLATLSVHDLAYYQDDSPFHVMGMGGNVSEWLADPDPADGALRLVAGGAWSTYDLEGEGKVADRLSKSVDSSSSSIGFRCAMDVEPALKTGRPTRLDQIKRAGTLRVGAEEESPPMLWRNEQKQFEGFEYELAKHLARALSVQLQIMLIYYPDLPAKLRADRIDLIVSAYTPDITIRGVEWSIPYLEYGLCLVVKQSSPIKSIADLDGKTVGYFNDPATARALGELVPGAKLVRYESGYLADLKNGQLDAFIYDFPFVQSELAAGYLDSLRVAQFGLTEATYNVGVPEGDWSLQREVNLAIQSMRESEAYGELIRRFLGGAPMVTDIPPGARTTLVQKGETLRTIAKRELGDETRWPEIWALNKSRIGNQNLLYVGSPLVLP